MILEKEQLAEAVDVMMSQAKRNLHFDD